MKILHFCLALTLLLGLTGSVVAGEQPQYTTGGIRYQDLVVGSGTAAAPDMVVTIHFVAWADDNGARGPLLFDSYAQGNPVTFKVGAAMVIQGWNDGVVGMQAGGKRVLYIPARFAYGAKGVGELIPPNTDLIYEIELIRIK